MSLTPPAIILDAPQLGENIGAVARVMANFGLADLRLCRPRQGWPQPKAFAASSGAHWPLDQARVFAAVADAVADLDLVLAATARPREIPTPAMTAREGASLLAAAAAEGRRTALLFGGERSGLETADIALCRAIVTVPVDPRFSSLNLAQAAAVMAYEWRLTQDAAAPVAFARTETPADGAALRGLFEHLEGELDAAGFFHPPEKRAGMVRNLRALFSRAALSDQEVRTLRGVITALSKGRGRVLAKLAAKRPSP
ncbi:MAG TPA: RNA methyltransferase [Caulobacteraceae bacterium]|nr:RNA methyltransferase [Caulobacteraceae bacterium]